MTQAAKDNEYALHEQLVSIIDNSKKSFVEKGKLLYELKQNNSFKKAVGSGIDTWDDYISQPEISLSRNEANRLMQIYEVFIVELGYEEDYVATIPIKNLHYLLPIAKEQTQSSNSGYDFDELISAAGTLKQKDFKERVGEIKYPSGRTYEYLVMKRCKETGSLTKVHDVETDQIKSAFGLD